MLLQRILTAIPLAAGIIWIILFQPTHVFFWLTLAIIAVAAYEWANLAGLRPAGKLVYSVFLCALTWAIMQYAREYVEYVVYAGVIWWFGFTLYLFKASPSAMGGAVSYQKLFIGALLLPATVFAMNLVHAGQNGPAWLLYALMLVWVADIGAYFTGKRFGRVKLAPHISPGKTREGLYGAVAAVAVYSVVASAYFGLDLAGTVSLLVLAVVLTLISVAGDLYESVLKRERGIKDSGSILPGHGGILDRIDSVIAAMPVFMAGQQLLFIA